MREAGKGSAPRPYSVSNEEYAARWDAIFGRDEVVGVKEFLEKATETSQPLDKEDPIALKPSWSLIAPADGAAAAPS